jgi:hypothetical protein
LLHSHCARSLNGPKHTSTRQRLRDVLKTVFSFAPTAAGAERNWSVQEFIFSKRRNRLAGERGTDLVFVYWNLRALAAQAAAATTEMLGWRESLQTALPSFPHPTRSWAPFSNWRDSSLGSFDGMHGDEQVGGTDDSEEEEGEEDEMDDSPAPDWSQAATVQLRPCPTGDSAATVAASIARGDKVVVCFGAPYSAWYVGTVVRIDWRYELPVFAVFEDGEAATAGDPALYGVMGGREWALLQPVELAAPGAGLRGQLVHDLDDE